MSPEPTLREKKTARTKLNLMNAFIQRLNETRFEQISIREVCDSVEVSEGTFYNYFPQKTDVIRLYMQIMTMKMFERACESADPSSFLDRIDKYFEVFTDELDKPNIMYAILSIVLSYNINPSLDAVSDLDGFLSETLKLALNNEELPKDTDLRTMRITLKAMLLGTPIALKYEDFKQLGSLYKHQLIMIWNAAGRRK